MKHYDYMSVRSRYERECRCMYGKFGWEYVRDKSERGGRYSFRRGSDIPDRSRLEELQRSGDELAERIDRIRGRCRTLGHAAGVVVAAIGLSAACAGMSALMRGSAVNIAVGSAVCAVGAMTALLSFAVSRSVRAAALAATRSKRAEFAAALSDISAEAEKLGYSGRVL